MRRSIPAACAATFLALSCTENLPSGPGTFVAQLKIVVPHDTVVVGDTSVAQAQALDASGNRIQSLAFVWSSADSGIVGLVTPASPDTSAGRVRRLVGGRTGRSNVSLSLPDPRFVSSPTTRSETVVLGGVRVLTTHDSTLTAVNDTAVAVAAGLVRVNGTLVPKGGQGVRWVHLGGHTSVVVLGIRRATSRNRTGRIRSSRRRISVWRAPSARTPLSRASTRRSRLRSRRTCCARGASAIR